MKKLVMFVAAAFALVACATASSPSGAAGGALDVAELEYHYRELPNGLRVYAMPDPNTANVAIQVWYRVGYRDDPQGRSGFAHLFEHMLFKATRNMPDGLFTELTTNYGGTRNASTHEDYTDYWEIVPANQLERLLWAESERMGSLVVDPTALESETDVVKEELRQRVLASPYGRLFYFYLAQANFTQHPYGRPGIGSIADLESSTIDDVRAFHATYYRPDNAILVVAGNFNLDQFNQWVDEYFAPIESPDRPIPRVEVSEPTRTAARTVDTYAPNVPLPAVALSYLHEDASSPDTPVMFVLDAILANGQSSRLYQSLVYEQQVATSVFSDYTPSLDPGAYSVFAILTAGQSIDDGEAALRGVVERLRTEPVSAAELEEAKNELVMATLQGRETAFGRSAELADAVFRYDDPEAADRMLAAVQRVTAADVQRVAQRLFADNNRVTIRYQDESARPAGDTSEMATSPGIVARPLAPVPGAPVFTLAPEGEREQPPALSTPVNARIPQTSERTLANGLRVIVAPRHDVPLISADLRIASAAASDPEGLNGLAGSAADLLTRGTTTRSATEIAQAVESLGASLNSGAGTDSSQVFLQTRSDRVDQAFPIFADVVRNPAFAEDEITRSRREALDGLRVAMRQPGSLASFAMTRAMYGDGPYGGIASPTTLNAMTRDDLQRFHSTYWRPDNAVLVLAGDVTPQQGFALAQRYFGDWQRPAAAMPARPDLSAAAPEPRTIVVDLPQTGQAAVRMGVRGVSRSDPDYFNVLLANMVMGGGTSARLNQEIRVQRGLSYGAGSGFSSRQGPGPIVAQAQTRNDAAVQVYELIQAELTRLGDSLPTATELEARQAALIGGFGRSVETTGGIAGQISTLALFGLPPERLNTYVADVSAVTPEAVRAAGQRYFDPATADLVIAGDAQYFYDALRQRRPDAERIPVTELNLDSETLR
ncbi:MAG: pitrilysin family protein [Hyphomonadaceae bacterium]